MRRASVLLLCGVASISLAFGQQPFLRGRTTTLPVKSAPAKASSSLIGAGVTPLPMWNYSIVGAQNGVQYSGAIIGRSPFSRGKTTTSIPTQIVPLVITIQDGARSGNHTYDPTTVDSCVTPGTHTDVEVITGSPIFQNQPWTMNGINVGTTQYIDAFQRAEFWSLVGGSAYHLMLDQSTLPAQSLTFNTANGNSNGSSGIGQNYTFNGLCGPIGVVQINDIDNAIQNLITGPLATMVNAGTFPIFLTKSVVFTESGTNIFGNCCILGYHSGFMAGSNLQIYSPFSLDTTGGFGGDVSTLSHEMGEAINDPTVSNPTMFWGNIGQVVGTCQNNFEVGDPLSPGFGTPTNEFTVNGANGLTYHLQELAFFSWFYGGNLGAGGKYSDNGTFGGFAKPCPPGGTN